MRWLSMPAAAWCLAAFLLWELLAAASLAFYLCCPCCWPFLRCELDPSVILSDPRCLQPPCVRKCCAEDEQLFHDPASHNRTVCTVSNSSKFTVTKIPLWNIENGSVTNVTLDEDYDRYSIVSFGLCPNGMYKLDADSIEDRVARFPDGRLFMVSLEEVVTMDGYCIENFVGKGTEVFKCFSAPDTGDMTELEQEVFPLTLSLSVPFLLLTVAVYLLLPELRNLHGKSLLCHSSALTIACVCLVPVQSNIDELSHRHPSICFVVAFVIQFSFLATFFWLNVMCFDIWWVFSGLRPLRGSVKEREHKKFIMYSLYAWGSPLIIFAVTLVMELAPFVPKNFIKPHFGVDKCWFKDPNAQVLYFYLPIGVLILLNIVMFVTTAIRLRAHTKETRVLKSSESSCTDKADRQRFNLYLKLFVVMGINWVMELVSFVVGGPKHLWFVTDIGNTLQGVLIFLIFVWKRRILRMVNQKLCPRWSLVAPPTNSSRSKVSSSSRTSSLTLSKTVSTNPDNMPLKSLSNSGHDDSDPNN